MAKKKNTPSHVSRPVFPGGVKGLRRFVARHLTYPPAAKAARTEGTVVVRYTLDYTGKVTAAVVKKGIGHGCDEEAVRVVKLLRFQIPQQRKKKVRIHQDLNVHFRLPKTSRPAPAAPSETNPTPAPPPPQAPAITRIVYSRPTTSPTPDKTPKKEAYRYKITLNPK